MTIIVHKNNNGEQELCRFSIPTKQCDGRTTKKIKTTKAERTKKKEDSFLYYSLEKNRIKALLGDDADLHVISSNSLMGIGTVERNTRISFEVHPILMHDEQLTGDLGVGMDNEDEDYLLELLDC